MSLVYPSLLLFLSLQLALSGCVTPGKGAAPAATQASEVDDGDEPLNDSDLKLSVPWDHLSSEVQPGRQLAARGFATLTPSGPVAPSQPAKLELNGARPYEGGVLGWYGSAKAFVAPLAVAPDESRLYRIMVRVLSEKFSCFMRSKHNDGPVLQVSCADGRRVVLKRERGADFVQFHARQYDREGYEVLVHQHRVIRVAGPRHWQLGSARR